VVDTDTAGRPVLTLTLPDGSALDSLARSLGTLLSRAHPTPGAPRVLN
jgi:hypothetical protein